ncbi:MAG TPA: hypothetical protein VE973_01950 [Candidatus Limnocylindria bacterium]|nr:hypothetical protein [Candidatus Limnocylindria bacterium]
MINWISALIPSFILIIAIFGASLSGNDKAPILVLGALIVDVIIFITLLCVAIFSQPRKPGTWLKCGIAALPLLYVIISLALFKAGLVDLIYLLGFR